ncbi:MAG TPA: protease HtpX, partial [Methylomirabilota bacterium]
MGNLIKTWFLLTVLTCLLVLAGGAIGGQQGMVIAFVLAFVMNVGSYWFSD